MRALWIYVLLFSIPFFLDAYPDRDARGNYTENFTHLQVQVKISMPSLTFVEGEDIGLEFHVRNFGKEVVRIFPATNPLETFQLQIRDENNRLIPLLETSDYRPWDPKYQKDMNQTKRNHIENLSGDASKEIALAPNETFSYRVLIQENYDIKPGLHYTVNGYFYPNATESKKNFLLGGTDSEGRLAFMRAENTIRFLYDHRRKNQEISGIKEQNLNAGIGVSPEETVFLFLGAEMKNNWSNYFKWIHIPDFILAYDRFSAIYLNSTDREKELVEDEFKEYLSTLPSGKIKYFKVLSVDSVSVRESRVKVYVERLEEKIPTRYEYDYSLKKDPSKRESLWKIHGVVARVRK
ncbi:MAG: hypothetical protein JJT78_14340 [Leptospira sp.]|nr:hypothetical protein [Leptospira sp.]